MAIEVRIPTLGESVSEGVIVRWIKADGEAVKTDEPLLELETDKASVEIPAERAGVLRIVKPEGSPAQVGEVVARIEEDGAPARPAATTQPTASAPKSESPPPKTTEPEAEPHHETTADATPFPSGALSPAVRRLVEEHGLDPRTIKATGRGGRLTKEDVLSHIESAPPSPTPRPAAPPVESAQRPQLAVVGPRPAPARGAGTEERVPMTRLRQRIAERLVQAQHTAGILHTFH